MSGDPSGYEVFVDGKSVLASWIMAESEGACFRGCRSLLTACRNLAVMIIAVSA
jgi:hypothetical protein